MGGNGSKEEARHIRQEAVLWFGFVASLATLVTLVISVTDLANRAQTTNDELNEKLNRLLQHEGIPVDDAGSQQQQQQTEETDAAASPPRQSSSNAHSS